MNSHRMLGQRSLMNRRQTGAACHHLPYNRVYCIEFLFSFGIGAAVYKINAWKNKTKKGCIKYFKIILYHGVGSAAGILSERVIADRSA